MEELKLKLTNEEMRRLRKAKSMKQGQLSWEEFIIRKCCKGISIKI